MGKWTQRNREVDTMTKGWKVVDDYTGFYTYSSKVVKDYLGLYTRPDLADYKHPQELTVAINMEKPLPFVRAPQPDKYIGWLTDEDID